MTDLNRLLEIAVSQKEYLGEDKVINAASPVVSIHVITYQHKPYIKQCIENLLNQVTNFQYEIVIGEDGSDDGTREICMDFAERYPDKIRLFLRKRAESVLIDEGRTFYLNGKLTALACRGEYIAICEGDDYWTNDYKLQVQYDYLLKNLDYSLCFHNCMILEEETGAQYEFTKMQTREYLPNEMISSWIIPTGSVMFRRAHYNVSKLINPKYLFGDLVLFLSLAERGKIWCINEAMSVYRRHSGGLSFGVFEEGKIIRFIEHYKELKANFSFRYADSIDLLLSEYYLYLSFVQLRKMRLAGILSIVRSLRHSPKRFTTLVIKKFKRL